MQVYNFCVGALGTVALFLLLAILISDEINIIDATAMFRAYSAFLVLCIFAITFFILKKRKYISLGIIFTIAIPTVMYILVAIHYVQTGTFTG